MAYSIIRGPLGPEIREALDEEEGENDFLYDMMFYDARRLWDAIHWLCVKKRLLGLLVLVWHFP